MKTAAAVDAFAALGQETRLAVFRALVVAGPEGLSAGALAEHVGSSPSRLTFHARLLERVGLVTIRREGRQVIYSANFRAMGRLVDFLAQDCCGGHPEVCRPLKKSQARRKGK